MFFVLVCWEIHSTLQLIILLCKFFENLAVDSDAANKMMDLIREKYVQGDLSAIAEDPSGIKLVSAEEFG